MFKKFKDKLKGDEQANSSSSPEIHHPSGNRYFGGGGSSSNQQQYGTAPTEKYQSVDGPPPGYGQEKNDYKTPAGPPPSQSGYAPPSGPPPSQSGHAPSNLPQQPPPSWDPPPYHDWTVIPDTALLPPPPSLGYDTSPTANASAEDGDRAKTWTDMNPLWPPQHLTPPTHAAIQNAQLALLKPPSFLGDVTPQPSAGHWRCHSHASCRDSTLLTNLPIYAALHDSPLVTQQPRTLYFEIKVTGLGRGASSLGEADAGIAIGFVAPPYPTFRLPGWERASLGVHGDDGRRYVNDPWGGVDFTNAFGVGETLGVGVTFGLPKEPPGYEAGSRMLDIDVFFTREGVRVGGWDGNEELDVRSEGGNVGLRGERDLFPAVGVFGGVDFDVVFHHGMWMYKPW